MGVITIKPYVDHEEDKIGLAGLGLNSFPGTSKISKYLLKMEDF